MPLVPTSPRTCAHRDAEFRQRPSYQVGKASHNYRGLHWHLNLLNRLGAKLRQQMACAADSKWPVQQMGEEGRRGAWRQPSEE